MNLEEAILTEMRTLPQDQQQEVFDFTLFLKLKQTQDSPRPSLFGSDKDKIHIADNFDEPLEEFEEYL